MKNFLQSTPFIMLFLGFCFHASHQSFDPAAPESFVATLEAEQYTNFYDSHTPSMQYLCMVDSKFCEGEPTNLQRQFDSQLNELPNVTYTEQYTDKLAPSEVEITALKVADILTVISRVIIAVAGAIFGTRKALQKLNP